VQLPTNYQSTYTPSSYSNPYQPPVQSQVQQSAPKPVGAGTMIIEGKPYNSWEDYLASKKVMRLEIIIYTKHYYI